MNPARSIVTIFKKLRMRGFSAAAGALRVKLGERRAQAFYAGNLRRHRGETAVPGVTFIGDFAGRSSGGKVSRDFVLSLHRAGIPFQAAFKPADGDPSGNGVTELLTAPGDFNIMKHSHIIEFCGGTSVPGGVPRVKARIVFWEFETGLCEYDPSCAGRNVIVAMSDFNREVFRRALPASTPVAKILYPFHFPSGHLSKAEARRKFNLPDGAFIVFFNFDYESSYHRKNPYGAMRAFAEAFADAPEALLVFKTQRAKKYGHRVDELARLAADLGVAGRCMSFDSYLEETDLYSLTNACDVYLSLHRGEGFGLGVAEAMSLGKPVVVTDYSATTEFCNRGNSFPVPYETVKVKPEMIDNTAYLFVKEWADPDVSFAAECLRRLRRDPGLAAETGTRAREFIAGHFSTENFRRSVSEFLKLHHT
ncbi:MAG: glycosyltransferase family 4 protein [Kiritimatiellae bacterium]|nr:glycosyltransferase family 4 protein [Kiritimatiellia bacterium]